MVHLLFAGGFALIALAGALALELTGNSTPQWLVAVIAGAAGYFWGHVKANGTGNRTKV